MKLTEILQKNWRRIALAGLVAGTQGCAGSKICTGTGIAANTDNDAAYSEAYKLANQSFVECYGKELGIASKFSDARKLPDGRIVYALMVTNASSIKWSAALGEMLDRYEQEHK